ncbi:hypothetical protein ADUPG1_005399, partial [Aduncisulcus paluster]
MELPKLVLQQYCVHFRIIMHERECTFSECVQCFFYPLRLIFPPYLKATASDSDIVTLCLFGQICMANFGVVRRLTT